MWNHENVILFKSRVFLLCSGWDWTTEGCKAVYSNYTHVTCRCDHLSAIALQRGPKVSVMYEYIQTLLIIHCLTSLVIRLTTLMRLDNRAHCVRGSSNVSDVYKTCVISMDIALFDGCCLFARVSSVVFIFLR